MARFGDDPVIEARPRFGADDPIITPVGSGESVARGFVGGGGALIDTLGSLMDAFNPGMQVQRAAATAAAKAQGVDPDALNLNPLDALADRAREYNAIAENEIPADLTARVAGGGARMAPELAAALATGGGAAAPEALIAAARNVPWLGRALAGIVKGSPTAAALTTIQSTNLPDEMRALERVAETVKAGGLNALMAGLPVAVGEAPLVRMLTGAGLGAGTSAGVSALTGEDQDAANNILGALMGGALGMAPHPAARGFELPADAITPEMVDAFTANGRGRGMPPPEPAQARQPSPDDITDAEFRDIPRAALEAPQRRLEGPAADPPAEPAADLVRMLEGSPARPPETNPTPDAPLATEGGVPTNPLAAVMDAMRNPAVRKMAEASLARMQNSQPAAELAGQGADDAPPWWLAGIDAAEQFDSPPPAPEPTLPAAPPVEQGAAATLPPIQPEVPRGTTQPEQLPPDPRAAVEGDPAGAVPVARTITEPPGDANAAHELRLRSMEDRAFDIIDREIGWDQIGGRVLRENRADGLAPDVVGRTTWVGKGAMDGSESNLWRLRPDKALKESQAHEALRKARAGENLRPIEQRFVDYARRAARGYAEDAIEVEDMAAAMPEAARVEALRTMREDHRIEFDPADEAEALTLYQLTQRARDAGMDDMDVAEFAGEGPQDYAARLWREIKNRSEASGTDQRAAQGNRAGGAEGEAATAGRVAEEQPDLLGGPARRSQPQAVARAPEPDLFGGPRSADQLDAAQRAKDAARNGRTGTGRTDMLAGDGELFAGQRPEQGQIEEGAASRDMFTRTRGDVERERAQQDRNGRQDKNPTPAPPTGDDAGGLRLRPDATPELTRRGKYEVESLVRRFGGSVLGDSIARDFRETGATELVGKTASTIEDFAALAQVYRNPLFETLRYVFVDAEGTVVMETAVSSRMPASSAGYPAGEKASDMMRQAQEAGAVGMWLTHNHPSGNPTPSRADRVFTTDVALSMPMGMQMLGHVVIDHDTYSTIDVDGEVAEHALGVDEMDPLQRSDGAFVGEKITGPADAMALARKLADATPKDSAAVVTVNARSTVKLAVTIPNGALSSRKAGGLLSVLGLRAGGSFNIMVISDDGYASNRSAIIKALDDGLLQDVILQKSDGRLHSVASVTGKGRSLDHALEKKRRGRGVLVRESEGKPARAAESEAALEQGGDQTLTPAFRKWFGDSKVVDADGKPLVVYHGTDADFDAFAQSESRTGHPSAGLGHFFSSSPRVAGLFARDMKNAPPFARPRDQPFADRANTMPVYLSMQNPWVLTDAEFRDLFVDKGSYRARTRYDFDMMRVSLEARGNDGIIIDANPSAIPSPGLEEYAARQFVAFYPEQIKSATGNRGTFDPADPSIVREEPTHYSSEQQDFMRKAGLGAAVDQRTSLRKAMDWALGKALQAKDIANPDEAAQALFDRYHGIKRAEKETGGIPFDQSAYIAARQINTASTMEAVLRFGAPKLVDGALRVDRNVPGLLDALAPVADTMPQFLGWLVAGRARFLKQQGREHLMSDADIANGLSMSKGREAEFKQAAAGYVKIKKAILDLAEQTGTIDPIARATWDHNEYVPFYRVMDGGFAGPGTRRGLANQSAGIRTLKGGDQALRDPLGNIIANFTRLVDSAMKNRATLLAIDNLGPKYAEKLPMTSEQVNVPVSQVKKYLESVGVPGEVIEGLAPDALRGMARMLAIKAPEGDDVVRVMRKGKAEYYRIADPMLLESLTAFNEEPLHWAVKPFMWAKNLLTAGATMTPEFAAANLLRDTGEAAITSRENFLPLVDTVRGAIDQFRETPLTQDLMMAGSYFHGGLFRTGDLEDTAKAIRRALRRENMSQGAIEKHIKSLYNPVRWWEVYRSVLESTEMGSRISLARKRMEAGGSFLEGAHEAKDFLDFSMRGNARIVRLLTSVMPFLNARMQGGYRLGRTASAKDRRGRMLARMGILALASSALYYWNREHHADAYDELPDWDKDAYWHIMPGTEYHVRIPKPFELGLVAATVPERMLAALEYQLSGGEKGDRPAQTGKSLAHAITGTLALDPYPQLVKPVIEVAQNRNTFFDSPIESMGDKYKLPQDRKSATTSPSAEAASKAMAPMLGDSNLSPKQIEHLWKGYTAGMGQYLLDSVDWVLNTADGKVAPERALRDFPLIGRFARGDNAPKSTRYTDEFYDLSEKAHQIDGTIKDAALAKDAARVKNLRKEWGWLLGPPVESKRAKAGFMHAGIRAIDKASRQLSDLRKHDQKVYEDREMSPADKRKALDKTAAERNELVRRMVRKIREAERKQRG